MEGRCKGCKLWGGEMPQSIRDGWETDGLEDFRVCEGLSNDPNGTMGRIAFFCCQEDPDEVCTHPDFGCVLFEEASSRQTMTQPADGAYAIHRTMVSYGEPTLGAQPDAWAKRFLADLEAVHDADWDAARDANITAARICAEYRANAEAIERIAARVKKEAS